MKQRCLSPAAGSPAEHPKRNSRALRRLWPAYLTILISLASPALAQQASLVGRIEDITGRVIPGALVLVLNKDTGSSRRSFTDVDGFFNLPALIPGVYDIDVSADGFKRAMRNDLDIHSTQNARVDFTLQVGSVSQAVSITERDAANGAYGAGNILENATASGETVIDRNMIAALPLLGSNPFSLIGLTGGASHLSAFPDHLSERPFDNGGMDGYSINGGPAGGNNNSFLIDNAPNNTNEGLGFVPPPDAVREVNMVKNAYDASYGRTGGGITSVSLKSGSATLHGAAHYQLRNNALNANLTQLNAAGQPGAPYSWNEPGVEFDGPLRIPHLSGNRHPTYFLVSWDEIHDSITTSANQKYPTALERAGNFSKTPGTGGQPIAIYDPVTTTVAGDRTPFPGSVLPASRMDPLMARLMTLLPLPNSSCAARGCANFIAPAAVSDAYDAELTRIDHDLGQNEKFFVSVEHGNRHELHTNPGAINPDTVFAFPPYGSFRSNAGVSLNLTSILSPTIVSTSIVSWLRHNGNGSTGGGSGFDPASVGFSPVLATLFGAFNLPSLIFPGSAVNYAPFNAPPGGAGPGSYNTTYNTNWTASNTLIQTKQRHTVKAGFTATVTLQNSYSKSTIPAISFSDVFTRANYLQSDPNSGDAIATGLLGYPTGGSYTNPVLTAYAVKYYASFLQDDWRITNALTLSLGLRWDHQSPPAERYNRAVTGFDPSTISTIGNSAIRGGLVFASAGQRSPYAPTWNEFQPRIGIAYAISRKLVFRGGWGRSYVQGYPFGPATGFASTTNVVTSSDGTNRVPTLVDNLSGLSANGFAHLYGSGLVPSSRSPGTLTGAGGAISFVNPEYRNPFVDGFNAGFDLYLPWRFLFHAEYNGSRGHRLPVSRPLNSLTKSQFISLGYAANTPMPNPFAGQLPGTTLNSSTWTLGQSLLPFPQFTSVTETNNPIGSLWYNSLQIHLDKRLSRRVALLSNFTWSKNVGATDYMNPNFDTDLRRVLTSIDQPLLLNIAVSWQLPGRRTGSHLLMGMLSGWAIAGSAQFQSGSLIGAPSGVFSTGIDPMKPDPSWAGPSLSRWFNTCTVTTTGARQNCLGPDEPAAWTIQPSFTLNNLSPRFGDMRNLRPPSASVSISKTVALKDRVSLQFRGDVFNLTNTPWFGAGDNGAGVNTSASSAAFGSVTFAQGNDPRTVQIGVRLVF